MAKNPLDDAARPRRHQEPVDDFDARIAAVNQALGLRPPPAQPDAVPVAAARGGRDTSPLKLTLVLPAYIHDAIDDYIRAHGSRRWTKRYLVLKALAELGVEIDPADLVEDGRRRG